MRPDGSAVPGADVRIQGDLAAGSGLSSAAALTMATGASLAILSGESVESDAERVRLSRVARRAENVHTGVPCGILDPFASALCQGGSALLLDCRSESFERIPFERRDVRLLLVDAGVRRRLGESAYAKRRRECDEAARLLHRCACRVRSLRDVSPRLLAARVATLPPAVYRRARHVVEENRRVQAAARALRTGDAAAFGTLLTECHGRLRDLFESSLPELDALVSMLLAREGVLGARLVRGGVGRAVLVAARSGMPEGWFGGIARAFERRYGRACVEAEIVPSDGLAAGAG